MKSLIKKIILLTCAFITGRGGFFMVGVTSTVTAGDFLSDVAAPLLTEGGYGDERAYNFGIDDTADLRENLKMIFFPDGTGDNQIWKFVRNIMAGLLVLAIIYIGARFVWYADQPDKVKENILNLVFVVAGALAIFLSVWILDTLLNIRNISGVGGSDPNSLVSKFEDAILLILGILKGFAFFLAIIFLAYNGIKMLYANGAEDKIKLAWQGVLNVILALIFIKIIDYVYFIAGQSNFGSLASNLIVQAARALGYVLGIGFVLAIIYAGYLMITGQGNDERIGQAKALIKGIAVVGLMILIFLLIVFQIFADVGTA